MEAIVMARISELLIVRGWYRRYRWAAEWSPRRQEYEVELRALVKIARKWRKVATPDPLDQFKSYADYHSWQAHGPEDESDAFTNREGMPEFNGAFR
jgi:hypothetical protein